MGGPILDYLNKYTIKSINSKDSTKARNVNLAFNVDWPGEIHKNAKIKCFFVIDIMQLIESFNYLDITASNIILLYGSVESERSFP